MTNFEGREQHGRQAGSIYLVYMIHACIIDMFNILRMINILLLSVRVRLLLRYLYLLYVFCLVVYGYLALGVLMLVLLALVLVFATAVGW